MKELQNKQRLKKLLYSIPLIILAALILFFLAKGAAGIIKKERDTSARVDDLKSETASLKARKDKLVTEIEKLKTEEGVEEEIRQKFNAAREGERVAIIVEEKVVATTTEPTGMERIRIEWERFKGLWSR